MRKLSVCALLFVLTLAPAFGQNGPTAAPAPGVTSDSESAEFVALREQVARKNKELNDRLVAQRAIVKKNQELLKEAQRLQAANVKLLEEQKKLDAQSAELQKQGQALATPSR